MRAPERLGPYVYRQSDTCFTLGGDSLALAAFASVRRGDRVCDLGCGAGALLLLLAARVSPLALSGVEYCPEDAAMARRNLAENGLEGAICTGDLRAVCKTLPAGGFSLAISNPPYFKAGSGGCGGRHAEKTARHRINIPPDAGARRGGFLRQPGYGTHGAGRICLDAPRDPARGAGVRL